ncbi:L-amino acid N-acyltransferase YncA [Microbacterium resistens]|uniref:L-amino acid N-acyltransferase YncA n=1 Tax=Microbacterium resistens TaxID=156977 RepID=A0ABU1SF18_9MICO|nr:L-amino acid N-acyltransferase YncA [Microbacterium resistens]
MTQIRAMVPADWARVKEIFVAGIAGGDATFETTAPTWEQFDAGRIRAPLLVATDAKGSGRRSPSSTRTTSAARS